MMRRFDSGLVSAGVAAILVVSVPLASGATEAWDADAVQSLQAATGGTARVTLNRATGAARWVRLEPGTFASAESSPEAVSMDFLRSYGAVFGIADPERELVSFEQVEDRLGARHLSYQQVYRNVPVFGAVLRTHVDRDGQMTAANGTFVPGIVINSSPTLGAPEAIDRALPAVRKSKGIARDTVLQIAGTQLMIYRDGLLQGIEDGRDHLVWEVEVTNGRDVREYVYVDAHGGGIVVQLTGVYDTLEREVYEPTFEPGNLVWSEGDAFPTGNTDYDNVISASEDTYLLFSNMTGGDYLSYDGNSATFINVIDPNGGGGGCPNAFANGFLATFCPGVTPDDVVSHEWTHNYTGATHGLIYAWQSGALNESYSDIYGEVVDVLNGMTDPSPPRSADTCSAFIPGGGIPPQRIVTVTAPVSIAGEYEGLAGSFGAPLPTDGLSGDMVLVDDGVEPDVHDGCETPFVNASELDGKIALINRGECEFGLKSLNAEDAGSAAVIIMNNVDGDAIIAMGGGMVGSKVTIPPLMVSENTGITFRSETGLVGDIEIEGEFTPPEDSFRWLVGENSEAFGGAIRDMWTPGCFGDPGSVLDDNYLCTTLSFDQGGVHFNSGVPNHAFALLVDGGEYNGQTIAPIGMTRASAIYWQAMTVYQVPTTDFVGHAESLSQSCDDLIGAGLFDLSTGAPSPEVISAADCAAVEAALAATEMREDVLCDYEPILPWNPPPPLCMLDGNYQPLHVEDFEIEPTDWQVSNIGVYDEYEPRDWEYLTQLPAERAGSGYFGLNSIELGDCVPGSDDQSGAMALTSPPIEITADEFGTVNLAFWHYVATELRFDGGHVRYNVNREGWQTTTAGDFFVNPYNDSVPVTVPGGLDPVDNPLAGEEVFSGSDEGSNIGSWGQSQLVLPELGFQTGDRVQVQFVLGVDGCNGLEGWYVDDVELYTCGVTQFEDDYFNADFTGNGRDEFGARRSNIVFMFRRSGLAGFQFKYGRGNNEDQYLFGDVDGDGQADVIVRRGDQLLATTSFDAVHDLEWIIGDGTEDEYFVGSWNGGSTESFATRAGSQLTLYSPVGSEVAQFSFGTAGDEYHVGDFNGDGTSDFAVRRGGEFFVTTDFDNTVDFTLSFGDGSAEQYLIGDWSRDGTDTLAGRTGSRIVLDVDGDGVPDVSGVFGNGTRP